MYFASNLTAYFVSFFLDFEYFGIFKSFVLIWKTNVKCVCEITYFALKFKTLAFSFAAEELNKRQSDRSKFWFF